MDVISSTPNSNMQVDQYPLLVECIESSNDHEHIIDITRHGDTLSISLNEIRPPGEELVQPEDPLLSGTQGFAEQASSLSSTRATSRNSSFTSRGDGYGHYHRNPLNSGLWISIELLVTVGQIIASVIILVLSRNEKPQAPLFIWVLGYASSCTAALPILYWRFHNRDHGSHPEFIDTNQESLAHEASESGTYTSVSVSQPSNEENFHARDLAMRNNQNAGHLTSRLNGFMEHLKMALDCFFAVWFVVGNVWIFGGHSSPSDAPKLYKLCIVFLTFSCIGYAMPFILCATICCCMPCIISLLGIRENFSQTRGATLETINSLPTYKFKLTNGGNDDECDDGEGEGGILDADSEKRRAISREDAMCCICLSQYMDDDELRELPCTHVFHVGCVDKWLKINASCPLCKFEIGESNCNSDSTRDSSHQQQQQQQR